MSVIRNRVAVSQRDLEVLRYVQWHESLHGEPPTRVEIAKRLGVSAPTAHGHVHALAQHGMLKVLPARHRGIRMTAKGRQAAGESL